MNYTKNKHDKVFLINKKSYFCITCDGEFIGKEVNRHNEAGCSSGKHGEVATIEQKFKVFLKSYKLFLESNDISELINLTINEVNEIENKYLTV